MPFFVKSSVFNASSTRCPLIRSRTSRAFCGETRMKFALAVNSISPLLPCRLCSRLRSSLHRVTLELAGKAELAQLVAHHVFGHVHRDELLPVVHRQRVSHHFRDDRRTPRPGADHLFFVAVVQALYLGEDVRINKRTFFCRTCHKSLYLLALLAAPRHDELIGSLIVSGLVATRRLAPWGHRVTATARLAFTTAVRVIDRVHYDTTVGRANAFPAIASGLADRNA